MTTTFNTYLLAVLSSGFPLAGCRKNREYCRRAGNFLRLDVAGYINVAGISFGTLSFSKPEKSFGTIELKAFKLFFLYFFFLLLFFWSNSLAGRLYVIITCNKQGAAQVAG